MAKKPPAQRWRTIRGGTGNYGTTYYDTKDERDADAQRLATLDNDHVLTELWSASHPQDALNLGWASDGKVEPGGPRIYTEETITSALNRATDDILDLLDRPDLIRDALNLLVNVAIHYLNFPDEDSVEQAINASYDDSYAEVMSWVDR